MLNRIWNAANPHQGDYKKVLTVCSVWEALESPMEVDLDSVYFKRPRKKKKSK